MSRDSLAPRAQSIRIGLFLTAGIVVAALAILAIGEKGGLFDRKSTLYVYFDDISGLVAGAPVRLAGLDVGTVTRIEFPARLDHRQARVTLSLKSEFMPRIRRDSVALIDSKGLLGDKIINLTLGNANQPPIPDGGVLKAKRAPSIDQLAGSVEEAVAAITAFAKSANLAVSELTTERMRADLGRIAASTASILAEVEHGNGTAHRMLYDPKYAQDIDAILSDTRASIASMRAAIERVDRTIAAVEHGDGMAHELIYGESGKATVRDLQQVAAELAALVRQVREGKGFLHSLVYEPDNARALDELSQAATRINHMMGEIEKGRGTLGGLVVDPTVYEDLKKVLGSVERNVLLKALIRFTIKEGDLRRPATLRVEHGPAETSEAPGIESPTEQ